MTLSRSRFADASHRQLGLMLLLLMGVMAAQAPRLATAAEEGHPVSANADIAAQRSAVQRRYDEKARDCQQRFVVTSCLDAAQKERRDALAPLRQEEIRLDTLQRKQRAAARLEEIETKQRADATKEAAAAAAKPITRSAGQESGPAQQSPAGAPRPAGPIARPAAPRVPIGDDERQRREAASLARFQASQAAAEERRAAAAARNAKRAASGKLARPLPAADGASAP